MSFSAGTERGPQFMLEKASSDITAANGDGTLDHAALRQSNGQDGAASAALAISSGQGASKAPTRRPACKFGKR